MGIPSRQDVRRHKVSSTELRDLMNAHPGRPIGFFKQRITLSRVDFLPGWKKYNTHVWGEPVSPLEKRTVMTHAEAAKKNSAHHRGPKQRSELK